MTCFECKSEMKKSTTTYVKDLGNCLVIVRQVPCWKCESCGAIDYTGDVLYQLEQIVDRFRAVASEIAVVNYSAA